MAEPALDPDAERKKPAAVPLAPERDPLVPVAFALGWQTAEFYRLTEPDPPEQPPAEVPPQPEADGSKSTPRHPDRSDDLPGVSGLRAVEMRKLRLAQIEVGLRRFDAPREAVRLPEPVTTGLKAVAERDRARRDELRLALRKLHDEVLRVLTAINFRYGKAYGLGRALSDTCAVRSRDRLTEQFDSHRLANLYGWLTDLKTTFPPHAGETVCRSLQEWDAWVAEHPGIGDESMKVIRPILRRQGEVWRACLSGEKDPTDTLRAEDYVHVANKVTQDAVDLSKELPAVLRLGVPLLLLIALAGVVAASLTESGTAVVGALGALAGALGISWAGVRQTVGGAVAWAREPLWHAALDDAIVEAISRLDELPLELRR